jgi:hypothetical protein
VPKANRSRTHRAPAKRSACAFDESVPWFLPDPLQDVPAVSRRRVGQRRSSDVLPWRVTWLPLGHHAKEQRRPVVDTFGSGCCAPAVPTQTARRRSPTMCYFLLLRTARTGRLAQHHGWPDLRIKNQSRQTSGEQEAQQRQYGGINQETVTPRCDGVLSLGAKACLSDLDASQAQSWSMRTDAHAQDTPLLRSRPLQPGHVAISSAVQGQPHGQRSPSFDLEKSIIAGSSVGRVGFEPTTRRIMRLRIHPAGVRHVGTSLHEFVAGDLGRQAWTQVHGQVHGQERPLWTGLRPW